MGATVVRRGPVWIAEVVAALVVTATLLPMLLLYVLDLAAGKIAPDAAWALGYALGLLGIWVAVMLPDSLHQRSSAIKWTLVVALAVAAVLMPTLAWNVVRARGMNFGILIELAAAGVALHQLVRLIRLPNASRVSNA